MSWLIDGKPAQVSALITNVKRVLAFVPFLFDSVPLTGDQRMSLMDRQTQRALDWAARPVHPTDALGSCLVALGRHPQSAIGKAVDPHPPYDARAVANLILDIADGQSWPLTQLSLYKILYFAYGWYLIETGKALIRQDFEAWDHGPVVKVIRDEFKKFGKYPITSRACKLDIYSGEKCKVEPTLVSRDARFVRSILEAYHIHDAWKLSEMTHEPGSPWDQVWNADMPIGRLALRLRNDEIKAHFASLPKRFRLS